MDAMKVVQDYYTALQNGIKTGTLDFTKVPFSDDVLFEDSAEEFEGREAVEKMLRGFASNVSSCTIEEQYLINADTVCTVIIYDNKDGIQSKVSTEVVLVKDGIIHHNMIETTTLPTEMLR